MPAHRLDATTAAQAVAAVEKAGSIAEAARQLGIARPTLQNRLLQANMLYGFRPGAAPPEGLPAPDEAGLVRRLERDNTALRKRLRELQEQVDDETDLRQHLFGAVSEPVAIPEWAAKSNPASSSPGMPLLFASDFHVGATVRSEPMNGINSYDVKTFQERYQRLISRTIDLCFHHMVNPKYPGIIYARGGDMVHGDLHRNRETNAVYLPEQVRTLVTAEAWGIRQLADKFGRVHVTSDDGNHGRNTDKPMTDNHTLDSWDTLAAWWLQSLFEGDPRVTFYIPEGDCLFRIYDWWFCVLHGDRIGTRGGQGFIGPAAPIVRGSKKVTDYYAKLRRFVDYLLLAHYHTRMESEYGFSNGSLCGVSEYSKDGRMTPQRPEQWLLFVHPKRGVTCRWPIVVDDIRPLQAGPEVSGVFERLDERPTFAQNVGS